MEYPGFCIVTGLDTAERYQFGYFGSHCEKKPGNNSYVKIKTSKIKRLIISQKYQ